MKQRLFDFASGTGAAKVTCKNCGWSSKGTTQTNPQTVFDRSNDHECAGVESYAAFRERDARELAEWSKQHSVKRAAAEGGAA